MSREKKAQIIDRLEEALSGCSICILTDYRGLATAEMTDLRRKLQESGSEYRVVKNTLARFAATRIGNEDLASSFKDPVAIAFGYDDVTVLAKVLTNYIRDSKSSLSIKGAFWGDRSLTPEEVMTLSSLPPRDILLSRVLGQMASPISALLSCLTAPIRGISGVLQARIKQLEGE
ncbi:50S ribosomal protein L10 [Chloroflexota bacterium]